MTYEEKLDEVLEWQKQQAEKDKKIAELETRCNELFFQVNEKTERIAELEKENAKAKELLKEFVHHYKAKTIYIENMQDLLEQAEQFLSEVEK